MKSTASAGDGVRAVLTGTAVMLLVCFLLMALTAALMERGALSERVGTITAAAVLAVSAFAGALVCGKRAPFARLPLCLVSAAVFLAGMVLLHCILFRTGPESWLRGPVCAGAGALLGAVAASSAGKRRRK